ncbi:bcl-2-like protein 1 isoform X2 [Saccostrea echinata]|uniref:bcl-2-like protein 1 isoform X2 n=1 Tax=Saccostrea echinata TaxID=191078 RepID=UPI002A7F8D3C|nr:bcl-2-like protein 1 isoform X2 [Saccostrea echinata]
MVNVTRNMDPLGTRYLVVDYLNYRLSKNGHTWTHCPPLLDPPLKIHTTMREKGDEFEDLYRVQFQELVDQLHVTHDTCYPMFKAVVEELFQGGINWGRIVALFAFSGSLSTRCVEKGMASLVELIVEWMTQFIEQDLSQWIDQHGGWQGFVDFYSKRDRSTNDDTPWVKYGVIGAVGVLALGAFMTQRT